MRAAILREFGQPPEIGEFDDPRPGDGQEVVDVLAAGLNPVDILKASGHFYGGNPPLPSVVGTEGIARLADGRTVYFDTPVAPYGSFAERALIDPELTYGCPEGLDPGLAVVLGISGLAAWLALDFRAQLRAGETVLVLGAGGVVGQVAVQAAKLLGASRVVAAARSEERLDRALQQGADATVQIGAVDDLATAFREAGGGGVDVVVDPVWGEPAVAALDAMNVRGRLVQIGQSAGATAVVPSALVRGKTLDVLGMTIFGVPPEDKRAAYETMAEHANAGRLEVEVERIPLDGVADAWRRQTSSPGVKLVVEP
jgi:NADPH:quinone reductase-like Zn-dependent oxidoreductase